MSTNTPPSIEVHSEKTNPPDKASFEAREFFIERRTSSPHSVRQSSENLNAKLANPLAGISHEQLMADVTAFTQAHGLLEYTETMQKGALVAQDPPAFESLPLLTDADRNVLRREITHKWDQPFTLYYLVVMCSIAAAVQGVRLILFVLSLRYSSAYVCLAQMDESVINGANLFFPAQFGIDPGSGSGANKNQWLVGLVNSAPYVRRPLFSPPLTHL